MLYYYSTITTLSLKMLYKKLPAITKKQLVCTINNQCYWLNRVIFALKFQH